MSLQCCHFIGLTRTQIGNTPGGAREARWRHEYNYEYLEGYIYIYRQVTPMDINIYRIRGGAREARWRRRNKFEYIEGLI